MLNRDVCNQCRRSHGWVTIPDVFRYEAEWNCPVTYDNKKKIAYYVQKEQDPPAGCLRLFEQTVAASVNIDKKESHESL
jgi:hypothetical protein